MTIYDLIFFSVIAFFAYGVWQHNNISLLARAAAKRHCAKEGIQLLDQNVILTRIRIIRSHRSLFAIEREYDFEFSSLGDYRYQGNIIMHGNLLANIGLAPFKTPL
ncbi:MAG: hypothetical protein ACJA0C_001095 [Candidatus Endobugula sp.]|jgi:hypothetical protein